MKTPADFSALVATHDNSGWCNLAKNFASCLYWINPATPFNFWGVVWFALQEATDTSTFTPAAIVVPFNFYLTDYSQSMLNIG